VRSHRKHPAGSAVLRTGQLARLPAATVAFATLLACAALPLTADATGSPVSARAARALKATDTAKLRFVSASGAALLEEGPTTGTLPGKMRVRLDAGTTFSGSFTIYLKGGSITGHGTATPHGVAIIESFAGTLVITKGTGRYSHATGHTGLYGTFNRNSYALVIQTTGNLTY
jgi:hypothetical protein